MRARWVEARDFRNHEELFAEIPAGLTAVVGPNGRGKTNFLEAVYYLCALASPRVSSDLPLVRVGASSAYLRGEIESLSGRTLVEIEIRASGQNRVQVNRSAVRRKRDLRQHVRAVFAGPDDLHVVLGDPGERRRFMDEAVAALWPVKDTVAGHYERALRQRNRLLKDWGGPGEPPGLTAWDDELVRHGTVLTEARAAAVGAISDRAAEEFRRLSAGGNEALIVEYRPSVEAQGTDLPQSFRRKLEDRRGDELVRRTTLVGPHRDDLSLRVEGLMARGFASHGEAWGAAVSLRLALAGALAEEIREEAILLLDDPFSALDPDRRLRLAEGLESRGQLLLAVPDEAQVPPGAVVWYLKEGGLVPR
ncbi:MAG TPA: DNA replication and repair protein RecF [Actinomycetota bacterium]|nr:DNA replication and repair protein RecF [Actinomycetota bacterium]